MCQQNTIFTHIQDEVFSPNSAWGGREGGKPHLRFRYLPRTSIVSSHLSPRLLADTGTELPLPQARMAHWGEWEKETGKKGVHGQGQHMGCGREPATCHYTRCLPLSCPLSPYLLLQLSCLQCQPTPAGSCSCFSLSRLS